MWKPCLLGESRRCGFCLSGTFISFFLWRIFQEDGLPAFLSGQLSLSPQAGCRVRVSPLLLVNPPDGVFLQLICNQVVIPCLEAHGFFSSDSRFFFKRFTFFSQAKISGCSCRCCSKSVCPCVFVPKTSAAMLSAMSGLASFPGVRLLPAGFLLPRGVSGFADRGLFGSPPFSGNLLFPLQTSALSFWVPVGAPHVACGFFLKYTRE